MNTFALSDQFPFISLSRCSVQKTWIPYERCGYAPPVDEVNCELVISYNNLHGTRISFND